MIEIQNIMPIEKGNLLAVCDVHIVPWHLTLHEVKIFQKGQGRWLGMPSKEFTTDSGEKRYTDLITFDNDGVKSRFKAQVMGAIDKFLAENPEMKAEELVKADDELPF